MDRLATQDILNWLKLATINDENSLIW